MTESPVDIAITEAITEESHITKESPELEHLDSRQSDQTNISEGEETVKLDISQSLDTQERQDDPAETVNTKETSQLLDVNDEIMENCDSIESSKANGEVEMDTPDKEKEKKTAEIKVKIFVVLVVGSNWS